MTSRLPVISHFIHGQPVDVKSGRSQPVFNPATGSPVAEVGLASADEVNAAVAAASAAAPPPMMVLRNLAIASPFLPWPRASCLPACCSSSSGRHVPAARRRQSERLASCNPVQGSGVIAPPPAL